MDRDKYTVVAVEPLNDHWMEDVNAALPAEIAEAKSHGQLSEQTKHIKVQVGFSEFPDGHEVKFNASLTDTLREVFKRGAQALGKPLLPPGSDEPLDRLRFHKRHGNEWSDPITKLERPLWLALAEGLTRRFGIEYVLAVNINTRWGVAPSASMTPRELLTSFGLDPAQYSLYRVDSVAPLPADTPLSLKRGDKFEAQKDGRYGSSARSRRPARGAQTVEDDVAALKEAGLDTRLLTYGGQKYVEVKGIPVPSPPWSPNKLTILVTIPATYPAGGLDAFYIEMGAKHASGSIPYQSQTAQIDGRNWALISWHYTNGRPWNPLHDDLASHIEHCRGALLKRGVEQ